LIQYLEVAEVPNQALLFIKLSTPCILFLGKNEGYSRPVIPFDGFCSVTRSYLANLLVEENLYPSFLLAVLWSLMERRLYPTIIDHL
jgi:hypothetical protein